MSSATLPNTVLVQASRAPKPDAVWELSGLDRANHFLVLRGTWIFEGGLEPEQLKRGLGALLNHYPHLAGRMREGGRVVLNNTGVPFTHAHTPEHQRRQLEQDHGFARFFHPQWRQGRVKKGLDAPLALRLTELADGQVLSVTCTHSCMDGASFYGMVQRLSQLCAGRSIEPPVLDQGLLPTPALRSKAEVERDARDAGWRPPAIFRSLPTLAKLAFGGLTNRSRPIHLDEVFLARLRRQGGEGCPDDIRLGDNDLLTAHLSMAVSRLYGHRPDTPIQQVVVIDARRRIASIPATFVGNAALNPLGARFTLGEPLPAVAQATHRALAPMLVRPSPATTRQVLLARELMDHGVILMHFDISAMHSAKPTVCYVNNFVRMPIYDLDFGLPGAPVRPVLAIPHDLPDPVLLWPGPPGRGGVELYLTGRPDTATRALAADDPWWDQLFLRTV